MDGLGQEVQGSGFHVLGRGRSGGGAERGDGDGGDDGGGSHCEVVGRMREVGGLKVRV